MTGTIGLVVLMLGGVVEIPGVETVPRGDHMRIESEATLPGGLCESEEFRLFATIGQSSTGHVEAQGVSLAEGWRSPSAERKSIELVPEEKW